MKPFRQQRVFFWIAIAAIVIALAALLVPHIGNTPDHPAYLALLPIFFIGLVAPLSLLLTFLSILSLGYTPEAPSLAPLFQRPPPLPLA